MKILFLTAYSELAASSRTRVYDYFPFLEKKGIEYKCICFAPPFIHKLTLYHKVIFSKLLYYFLGFLIKFVRFLQVVFLATSYDIIFVQKIVFPFRIERIIKFLNKNIIFDFDDAIFTDDDGKKTFLNQVKVNFKKNGFDNMLKSAKCCIVENNNNKNIAQKYCHWVEIITGPIDTENYFVKEKEESLKVVVGWTGSPSTSKYLFEIENVLRELVKMDNVILRFMGVGKNFKMVGIDFETKEWSLSNEVSIIQTFDIGIMPLPNNEWTRGKGGYKLLQYMAAGIPPVASPVEINKEIIMDGVDGFLADGNEEWVKKVSILIKDKELRRKMGNLSRKKMEEIYSLKKASEKLISIFNKVIKN